MKIRSTGETPHQIGLKPAGKIFNKSNQVGIKALKMANFEGKKFESANKLPNPKEAKRVTKAAFSLFAKANKPIV